MQVLRSAFRGLCAAALFALCAAAAADEAADVAMVTAAQGSVTRVPGAQAVPAFVKLKRGDRLALAGARLQLVYFDNGRQETWHGDGKLEIGDNISKPTGLAAPETRTLPDVMVKQIAKTPALDSQGRAGVVRLRAIGSPMALAKLEDTYKQLRDWAEPGDLNPERFLLSGLFELHQTERIQQVVADLGKTRAGDPDAAQLAALYQKLLKDAR
jgi:hypothetical protein